MSVSIAHQVCAPAFDSSGIKIAPPIAMTEVHEQNAKELADIRQRIAALEKELSALKSGAWAGAIRYQQIMDGEPATGQHKAPAPVKTSNRER